MKKKINLKCEFSGDESCKRLLPVAAEIFTKSFIDCRASGWTERQTGTAWSIQLIFKIKHPVQMRDS